MCVCTQQGVLLQGRLRVSSFHPRGEATVRVRGEGREERTVMVVGMKDRNRAIHYDKVAIRLIPSQEVHSNVISTGGVAKHTPSAGKDHVMGVVVGVVQRGRSEYVASFEVSCCLHITQSKRVCSVWGCAAFGVLR